MSMKYNKIVIFANDSVGLSALKFVVKNYNNDLKAVVIDDQNESIKDYAYKKIDAECIFTFNKNNEHKLLTFLQNLEIDYIILAWWSYIIKQSVISLPKIGVINFHPSLLPFNRGKHYNFWNLVEDVPFGVTIHFVNEKIDAGDILFQKEIPKTWEDTGKTLYEKAKKAMIVLFESNYKNLINRNYKVKKQDPIKGSLHVAKELDPASEIFLSKLYSGKEMLNLLRARTFESHPACYFIDNEEKYEVRIKITKI
ncbi:MAG: hypothetical protein K8R31_05150 [Bacteroidales bacterium]|nr:hypothetical protein [Bacteroidales bacterium]